MSTAEYDTNSKELKHEDSTKNVFLCFSVNKDAQYAEATGFKFTYGTIDDKVANADAAKGQASAIMTNDTPVNAKFMLAAASEAMTGAAASFTLQGAVDPQSTFAEGDVTVSTVYTLTAITKKQYDNSYVKDDTFGDTVADTCVKAKP